MSDKGKKAKKDKRGDHMPVETKTRAMPTGGGAVDIERHAAKVGAGRVVIEEVTPELDGGRHPVKVVVGDIVTVKAIVFTDGHEKIGCDVLWRPVDQDEWNRVPMTFFGNDKYAASFVPSRNIRHVYTVEGWRDPFASLLDGIVKKRAADQELSVEGSEAVALVGEADPKGAQKRQHKALMGRLETCADGSPEQLDLIADGDTRTLMAKYGPRHQTSRYDRELTLIVVRKAAIFSAWYELFPRSITDEADRHGTFRDVIDHLPYVQAMGFDVLYFPPISTDREEKSQGQEQYADADRRRRRLRLRDRLTRWRPRRHPSRTRHTRGFPRPSCRRRRIMDWRSRSTSPSSARRTIPGSRSIRNGSCGGPTAPSNTPRTRPRSTRTSSTSTSIAQARCRSFGRSCAMPCCSGCARASVSCASTTRTPSRSRSGAGSSPRSTLNIRT